MWRVSSRRGGTAAKDDERERATMMIEGNMWGVKEKERTEKRENQDKGTT